MDPVVEPELFNCMDDAGVARLLHRLMFSARTSSSADDAS